jgi:hypothetical protein
VRGDRADAAAELEQEGVAVDVPVVVVLDARASRELRGVEAV